MHWHDRIMSSCRYHKHTPNCFHFATRREDPQTRGRVSAQPRPTKDDISIRGALTTSSVSMEITTTKGRNPYTTPAGRARGLRDQRRRRRAVGPQGTAAGPAPAPPARGGPQRGAGLRQRRVHHLRRPTAGEQLGGWVTRRDPRVKIKIGESAGRRGA